MDTFFRDLRIGIRVLWKQKTLSLAAIATLGICIAATTAIFCIVNAIVLRPLPFAQSDRIAYVYNAYPRAGVEVGGSGVPDYYDRRAMTSTFGEVAIFRTTTRTIGVQGSPERVTMMMSRPSLFRLLGVKAAAGRLFSEQDAEPGNDRKVILSFETWQRLFAGRSDAIGQDLRISEVPYTVIGVMPAGFQFWSGEVTAWIPAAFTPADRSDDRRHSNNFQMIARLASGATFERAQREVDALNVRNFEILPQLKQLLIDAGFRTGVVPAQSFLVRDVKGILYLLWGGSLFVLLIGCVNIANLTLLRASSRMKELATRHALGAGWLTLARQLVAETMLLALAGGAVALLLGNWMLSAIRTLGLERLPRAFEVRMDGPAAIYAFLLTIAIGVLVGLAPVVALRQRSLAQAFRDEGRSGTAAKGARLVRRALVTAQVALALVLLAGSALLFASFRQMLAVDPGFRPDNVWSGIVSLPDTRYRDDASRLAFQRQLLDGVRAIPGVTAAGMTDIVPFGPGTSDSVMFPEGYQPKPGESIITAYQTDLTPGYFETMGIRLQRGRFFDDHDTATSLRVIIVDDRLAKRFWPKQDPVGKRMWRPEDSRLQPPTDQSRFFTVVGVVNTVHMRNLTGTDERFGAVYYPMAQDTSAQMITVARGRVDAASLTAAVRAVVRRLDPELPVFNVRTMTERRDTMMQSRRTPVVLSVAFGAIALFLAVIGIYGVLAYLVVQRRREIGIRMALGGNTRSIFTLVLREGFVIVAAGAVLGIAGTMALGRVLESQLYGVRPGDPLLVGATALVVAFVALLACLVPARRAAHTDPVRALNEL